MAPSSEGQCLGWWICQAFLTFLRGSSEHHIAHSLAWTADSENYNHVSGQSCVCVQKSRKKEARQTAKQRDQEAEGKPRDQGNPKKDQNQSKSTEKQRQKQNARDQGNQRETGNPGSQEKQTPKGHENNTHTHTPTHTTAQKDYQGRDFLIVILMHYPLFPGGTGELRSLGDRCDLRIFHGALNKRQEHSIFCLLSLLGEIFV